MKTYNKRNEEAERARKKQAEIANDDKFLTRQ